MLDCKYVMINCKYEIFNYINKILNYNNQTKINHNNFLKIKKENECEYVIQTRFVYLISILVQLKVRSRV